MAEPLLARVVPDVLSLATAPERLRWLPLRPGVDIYRIYGGEDGDDGPAAALLRYQPNAQVPNHQHMGWEHILVLTGNQTDEQGEYSAGTLLVNPPGSYHSVTSPSGCVVLALWERPVRFVTP